MSYFILSTNVNEVSQSKELETKNSEVSVAVLKSDLEKSKEPKLYAFRWGMLYDPENGFKPNVPNNHKLPDKLIPMYYSQLEKARIELKRIQSFLGDNNADTSEYVEQIKSQNLIIEDQNNTINELKANMQNNSNDKQLEEMMKLLQAVKDNKPSNTTRIEIKVGKEPAQVVDEIVHEKFTLIMELLNEGQAVYLHGSAGTGKSELAKQIAKYMKLSFYPASTITQEFDLTGYQDGHGKYHEKNFFRAFKNGGLFFLDEMDSCSPEVLVKINGALANGYFDFPHETVYAHENFRIVSAGNTIGRGGDMDYTGRFALDISTLDRFWAVYIDYSEEIDKAVANNDMELVNFARAIRKASKETNITILMSYRSISRIAKFIDKFPLVDIMNMALIKGMNKDDVLMLISNMDIDRNNLYFEAFKKAV